MNRQKPPFLVRRFKITPRRTTRMQSKQSLPKNSRQQGFRNKNKIVLAVDLSFLGISETTPLTVIIRKIENYGNEFASTNQSLSFIFHQ